jgi:hypothetical protein
VKQFPDHGFDGMRCDVDGNLYITRYGKGTVVKLSPAGEVMQEIDVLGKSPSNLCFGGPDGRTIYVTEVEHTRSSSSESIAGPRVAPQSKQIAAEEQPNRIDCPVSRRLRRTLSPVESTRPEPAKRAVDQSERPMSIGR